VQELYTEENYHWREEIYDIIEMWLKKMKMLIDRSEQLKKAQVD